jgi:CRP/FNR family transcriptional regulator, cyclic AMP receptor protein
MKKISFNPFKKTYASRELERLEYFEKIGIFKGLTYDEISLFLPYLHERRYAKDEVIFFRGDPSLALYIIKSGVVSLSLDYQDDLEELTKVLQGSSIGESCMLADTKRLLNAIVDSEYAEMYVIPQLNILEIFENNISIKSKMMESLSKIYHDYNEDLFEAYRKSLGFFHLPMVYEHRRSDLPK